MSFLSCAFDSIAKELLRNKVDCVICGDDTISMVLMSRMQSEGFRISKDIASASLYDGPILQYLSPPVTAVGVSAKTLGSLTCRQMLQRLRGEEYKLFNRVDYEIRMKKSTARR